MKPEDKNPDLEPKTIDKNSVQASNPFLGDIPFWMAVPSFSGYSKGDVTQNLDDYIYGETNF